MTQSPDVPSGEAPVGPELMEWVDEARRTTAEERCRLEAVIGYVFTDLLSLGKDLSGMSETEARAVLLVLTRRVQAAITECGLVCQFARGHIAG